MGHWIEGHWYFSPELLAMCYLPPGEYEDGVVVTPTIRLDTHLLPGLFQAALEGGILPLTPSRDGRTEDLRIIHRLLDIMSKGGSV